MTPAELLAVAMVVAVCATLMVGYPVGLTLGGVSLIFAGLGHALGVLDLGFLGALPQRVFGVMTNEVLLAIPLFVFMGVMLERTGVAEELLETMGRLFGALRGGLGISVVIVGTLLAAAKGVVGATTVTMGLITLPTMLRYGYDKRLAAGTVAATSTLAQIFPPATVLVLLGDQLNNSYQAAQLAEGNFAPDSVSVSDLFAGAIVPGLSLVALYMLYLVAMAVLRPQASPAIPPDPDAPRGLALARQVTEALVAPLALIALVLGSILGGFASPTEAAAVGAFGATVLAARKSATRWPWLVLGLFCLLFIKNIASTPFDVVVLTAAAVLVLTPVYWVWRAGFLTPVMRRTAQIVAMIFTILIGATFFSLVFRGLGGDDLVHRALSNLPGGAAGAILTVMVAMFLLGFIVDAFEIIFVVVPIVAPALLAMPGVDPVWLGIMMALNLQTSYMHPPLGPTLFFLRGVAPPEIATKDIYWGIVPFVLIQLAALAVLWFVPALATWLPHRIYGG